MNEGWLPLELIDVRFGTPEIAFETDRGELDLHNFAVLQQVCFSPDGIVRIIWVPFSAGEFKVGQVPISRLDMSFEDSEFVDLSPRDPEMPTIVDNQLEHFIVEKGPQPASVNITFVLANGRALRIGAARMRLVADTYPVKPQWQSGPCARDKPDWFRGRGPRI